MCPQNIISDRIEAGTYALAAVVTGGELILERINLSNIKCIANELEAMEARVKLYDESIIVSRKNCSIKSINVVTDSYPNFPSVMQSQLMSAMCIDDGVSIIEENVFDNRFTHANELRKLGAKISIEKNRAIIIGIKTCLEPTYMLLT